MIRNVSAIGSALSFFFMAIQASRIADASVYTANSILKTNKIICESINKLEEELKKQSKN
jgi:hypothetical protein